MRLCAEWIEVISIYRITGADIIGNIDQNADVVDSITTNVEINSSENISLEIIDGIDTNHKITGNNSYVC